MIVVKDILLASTGGVLIGAAALVLLIFNGRIAGLSGILDGALHEQGAERGWRLAMLLGLLVGGVTLALLLPSAFPKVIDTSSLALMIAGFLVGVGTRMGGGCTSGHGVCGMGRMSGRSIVATIIFMGSGIATVYLVRHVLTAGVS